MHCFSTDAALNEPMKYNVWGYTRNPCSLSMERDAPLFALRLEMEIERYL